MTDIVERLRGSALCPVNCGCELEEERCIQLQAADEIERLEQQRGIERTKAGIINWHMEVERLNRLTERLHKDVENANFAMCHANDVASTVRAVTIEECARVADKLTDNNSILGPVLQDIDTQAAIEHKWFGKGFVASAKRIAAAIRALKEQQK